LMVLLRKRGLTQTLTHEQLVVEDEDLVVHEENTVCFYVDFLCVRLCTKKRDAAVSGKRVHVRVHARETTKDEPTMMVCG
jgi:hypothetical protein